LTLFRLFFVLGLAPKGLFIALLLNTSQCFDNQLFGEKEFPGKRKKKEFAAMFEIWNRTIRVVSFRKFSELS
jgi:hypothetical protein